MVILFQLLYPNLLYIQIYDIVLFQHICIRSPLLLVHTAALLLVKWTYFWVMAYSEHHLYCCGRSLLVPLAVPHEAVVSHSVQFFSLPRKFFPACLCNENHTTKYPIGSMYAMVTWIPSIYPSHVSIYTMHGSVMGMGLKYRLSYNHSRYGSQEVHLVHCTPK